MVPAHPISSFFWATKERNADTVSCIDHFISSTEAQHNAEIITSEDAISEIEEIEIYLNSFSSRVEQLNKMAGVIAFTLLIINQAETWNNKSPAS